MVRAGSFSGRPATIRCAAAIAVVAVFVTAAPRASATDVTYASMPVPSAGGEPVGIATGPGGIWYTDAALGLVGHIDAGDTITEFALPEADSAPTAIAAGPDGALWFTEPGTNAIGRMTPAGEAADFPLPAVGSSPAGIAAGPDGNVWVTLSGSNRVGWANATAGLNSVVVGASLGLSGITRGPDGAMWFTARTTNQIGRIDVTTKAVAWWTLPGVGTALPRPGAITSGTDGALWFTMQGTNQVGRMTTAGVLTTYDLPDAAARPTAIAAAPDGAIWFTETAVDKVGRLADGVIETFPVGDAPKGITVETDGDVWVAVDNDGLLTRISLLPDVPVDETDPTITIDAPAWGSWTVAGTGGLAADYACNDETSLASCTGDVTDGAAVDDGALGSHIFDVHAEDTAGNGADASASYLVFASASGTVLGGAVGPSPWFTLSLGMDLPKRAADPLGTALVAEVDCRSGAIISGWTAADVRTRVAPQGTLELRWRIDRAWTGCRSLSLSFTRSGWDVAPALFGPVVF